MRIVQQTGLTGTQAVKMLRKRELHAGRSFMINLRTLPPGQFYIEHPSGIIQPAVISGSKIDYQVLKKLDEKEAASLRAQYDLY